MWNKIFISEGGRRVVRVGCVHSHTSQKTESTIFKNNDYLLLRMRFLETVIIYLSNVRSGIFRRFKKCVHIFSGK